MEILIKNESKKSTYVNPRKKISAESQRYADEAPVIDNSYVPQPQNNDSAPTKTKNVVPFNVTHKKIRSGIIAFFFRICCVNVHRKSAIVNAVIRTKTCTTFKSECHKIFW